MALGGTAGIDVLAAAADNDALAEPPGPGGAVLVTVGAVIGGPGGDVGAACDIPGGIDDV